MLWRGRVIHQRQRSEMRFASPKFSATFEHRLPFVAAGMAFVGETAPLCVATCRAGGIGAIAGSFIGPDRLAAVIDEVRAQTDAPFHVNLLVNFPHDDLIEVLIAKKVPIVSFHWGLSTPENCAKLAEAGITLWVQVGDLAGARAALKAGATGLIAQGLEAGGHNLGTLPLLSFLPQLVGLCDQTLLIAAGGIADGASMAAALKAGADAVWVGTALVATHECDAHDSYKARLVAAAGDCTELTTVYGPENMDFNPIRMLRNDTIRAWHHRAGEIPADRSAMPPYGQARFGGHVMPVRAHDAFVPARETVGDFDLMPLLAGQGVGLVQAIEPAAVVIKHMCKGAAAILRT
jgi:NAD(P)H-dependent flavin oxidoreductase YrpB (nitropropane dioxygenase family)